jgi:hypothetical protein
MTPAVIRSVRTAQDGGEVVMTTPSSACGTFSPAAGEKDLGGNVQVQTLLPSVRGEKVPQADEGCVIRSGVERPGRAAAFRHVQRAASPPGCLDSTWHDGVAGAFA